MLNPFIWGRCEFPWDLSLFFFLMASNESHCLTPLVSTIDLFLQGNPVCELLTQTLGNEDHEKVKGQQMLPLIPLTQEQNKLKQLLEDVVCEEGLVTLIPYQCVLSGFTRFQDLTPTFFQRPPLGWLQRMQSFIATLKMGSIQMLMCLTTCHIVL